jgi:ComF family protein
MQSMEKIKNFVWDIIFPKFCVNCGLEETYLCPDCLSLIEIFERQYCPFCFSSRAVPDGRTCEHCRRTRKLNGLFCATSYKNFIVKKIIRQFKYEPFVKELAEPLSSFIIAHLTIIKKKSFFEDCLLIPVPLYIKRHKFRGFNQSEEIAKKLSSALKIPMDTNILFRIKNTPPQAELNNEKRRENIKNIFICKQPEEIKNRKIILVDDVFTTGSTMEEAAETLKQSGAKEVWGIAVARG